MQCNILTDIFDLVYLCFAKNVRRVRLYSILEKLAEMFLNTFHRDKIFEKITGYKVIAKIRSKNISSAV